MKRKGTAMTDAAREPAQHGTAIRCDPRWAQLAARDKGADGLFCYAVATTGVYCRPSCPSRAANPRNVRFFDTPAAAQAAGFRPCRRCNPNGLPVKAENAVIVAKACRSIEQAEQPPPWLPWRTPRTSARSTSTACSRPLPVSRRRPTPTPAGRRGSGASWQSPAA